MFKPSLDRTQNLNEANIREGFKALGISLSQSDAKLIIKRYDNDRDGLLSFTDICGIFKPRDPLLGKEFQRRLPYDHKKTGEMLSLETL